MYDISGLEHLGNIALGGRIVDTMIATALIDENRKRYDLNSCSREYIGQRKR